MQEDIDGSSSTHVLCCVARARLRRTSVEGKKKGMDGFSVRVPKQKTEKKTHIFSGSICDSKLAPQPRLGLLKFCIELRYSYSLNLPSSNPIALQHFLLHCFTRASLVDCYVRGASPWRYPWRGARTRPKGKRRFEKSVLGRLRLPRGWIPLGAR